MKVYLVTREYAYEGENPAGVYGTLEKAWASVLSDRAASCKFYEGDAGNMRLGEIGLDDNARGWHIIREMEVL